MKKVDFKDLDNDFQEKIKETIKGVVSKYGEISISSIINNEHVQIINVPCEVE